LRDVNQVELIGHVGGDPEVKTFDNGGSIVKFSVATSERWKSKDGQDKEETCWHNIEVNGGRGPGDFAEKYIHKGDHVRIVGKIRNRKYEQNGETKYFSSVAVPPYWGAIDKINKGGDVAPASNQNDSGGTDVPLDDDIPF
jgi:single-strand DNA-binding protein